MFYELVNLKTIIISKIKGSILPIGLFNGLGNLDKKSFLLIAVKSKQYQMVYSRKLFSQIFDAWISRKKMLF